MALQDGPRLKYIFWGIWMPQLLYAFEASESARANCHSSSGHTQKPPPHSLTPLCLGQPTFRLQPPGSRTFSPTLVHCVHYLLSLHLTAPALQHLQCIDLETSAQRTVLSVPRRPCLSTSPSALQTSPALSLQKTGDYSISTSRSVSPFSSLPF